MGAQTAQDEAHELGVTPRPAVLDVEIHERAVHVREADADQGAVLVLPLVHHEDAVGPEEQVPRERHGGEGREPRGADFVSLVGPVEVLGGAAAVDVGGADEEDALAGKGIDGHRRSL